MNFAHRKVQDMSWSKSPRHRTESKEAPKYFVFTQITWSESDLFVHRSSDEVPIGSIVTGVQGGEPLTILVGGGPASDLSSKVLYRSCLLR